MRTVAEWIGKDDDTAIPARVKLRIFRAAAGTCAICAGRVTTAAYDHTVALINGGINAEHNVQLLCVPCHKVKTQGDVAEKSKVARVMSKHVGITGPRKKIFSRGFPKRPPQNTASRPLDKSCKTMN